MNFSTLDRMVRQWSQVRQVQPRGDCVVNELLSQSNPVILISGELHPGTYNSTGVAEALRAFLSKGNSPLIICWGPVTFLDESGRNDLYNTIMPLLNRKNVSILHSRHRQYCHSWAFGDTILYQQSHGYGASLSQRSPYYGTAPGAYRYLQQILSQEIEAGDIIPVSSETPGKNLRSLRVKIDEAGSVENYIDPASPQEALDYHLSLINNIAEIGAVQFRQNDSSLRIEIFLCDTSQSPSNSMEEILRYQQWTADRFPEFQFEFCKYKVNPAVLEHLRCDNSIVYRRSFNNRNDLDRLTRKNKFDFLTLSWRKWRRS